MSGNYTLHSNVIWLHRSDGSSCLLHLDGNTCLLDNISTNELLKILSSESVHDDRTKKFVLALMRERIICKKKFVDAGNSLSKQCIDYLVFAALSRIDSNIGDMIHQAGKLLFLAKIIVQLVGWSRAVRVWEQKYIQPANKREPLAATLNEIAQSVRVASARAAFPYGCKEQALCALALARKNGQSANLILGIQHLPIKMHAWTECYDMNISDTPEYCLKFQEVARYTGSGTPAIL